ncbi:hypothetical protein F5888DRAFT_1804520 [Russula emetica]|nr:hypothetical protein F5888DRAFT_1804520 [Russula emetica]
MFKKASNLGSGQSGESVYSCSQAFEALKEENIYPVLVNLNISTIATPKWLADNKPDGIHATGWTDNAHGRHQAKRIFATPSVQALGTQIETIVTMEDMQLFAMVMEQIGIKCVERNRDDNGS